MNESVSFKRNNKIDAIKSILIILVVIAHSRDRGILHDFIFLFHMPLFFVISGYFCKKKAKLDGAYIKKICTRYLIPYLAYMVLILLVLDRNFKFSHFIRLVYGGRALVQFAPHGGHWCVCQRPPGGAQRPPSLRYFDRLNNNNVMLRCPLHNSVG